MSDYKFIERKKLEKVDGTVDIVTVRSASAAIRLNNKRQQILSLYGKARLFDDSPTIHMDALNKAEEVAFDADMLRMILAVKDWNLPAEAFVVELEDLSVTSLNMELLREDVFVEINNLVATYWDPKPDERPEEVKEEETKNEQELSTSSSSAPSKELSSTKKK